MYLEDEIVDEVQRDSRISILDHFTSQFEFWTIESFLLEPNYVVDRPGPRQGLCELCHTFGRELFTRILRSHVVRRLQYQGSVYRRDGVILRDGTIIYHRQQGHNKLYEKLFRVDESQSTNWTDCQYNVKFTEGQLNGTNVYNTELSQLFKGDGEKLVMTEEQCNSLFSIRDEVNSIYGRSTTTCELLRNYTVSKEGYGTKYGNLRFLEKYYNVKIPKIQHIGITFDESEQVFLRTSPTQSLPGLLESILLLNFFEAKVEVRQQMRKRFEEVNNSKYNELFIFEQEFIEGLNGVAEYLSPTRGFRTQVSDRRGDVVLGKVTSIQLSSDNAFQLSNLCETLYKDFKRPIQLEYVIDKSGELYIVQLRLLTNVAKEGVSNEFENDENTYLCDSFSSGYLLNVSMKDVLIIEDECESEKVLGKKVLLVKSKPTFSHALALSLSLQIPSATDCAHIDFTGVKSIDIDTRKEISQIKLNYV